MTLAAGTRLGPYIVDGLLGTGGMGEVYRAQDTRLKRDVALKIRTLAYVPGTPSQSGLGSQLIVQDRKGVWTPLKLTPAAFRFPRASRDGRQIAYGTDDGKEAAVWIYDLDGTTSPRKLTFEGRNAAVPRRTVRPVARRRVLA